MLEQLNQEYDQLQQKYGAKELDSIYYGGCTDHPDFCFVFMNPTGRNIASNKEWKGLKAPWLGTKNIWDLFYQLQLLDEDVYHQIKTLKSSEWTYDFAHQVYQNITNHKCFITNLGKCTQIDARPLPNSVYQQYLHLLEQEISFIKPKVIILFGNQVSSIFLGQKISVSLCRKQIFTKQINHQTYPCYAVYYPVGNGRFNIDKSIEDIQWIKDHLSITN